MNPKLTVIIITKNEEADLPACLDSVHPLAAEIIVVDNHSSDATVEIAMRYTPHVHQHAFADYASQKQFALDMATGDWVLSIDADERVSPELAFEISSILNGRPQEAGFEIPFDIYFMGKKLRFGGLGGERHLRLFRRGSGRFIGGIHEGIEVQGPVGRLRGKILHIPYRNIREYLDKMDRYTTMAANERLAQHRKFIPLHHLLPAWEFFVRTILRLGILDGTSGITWAGLSSFHTWIKFLKLREMQEHLIETGVRQPPSQDVGAPGIRMQPGAERARLQTPSGPDEQGCRTLPSELPSPRGSFTSTRKMP